MTKEELKIIVNESVKNAWYGRRSFDPVTEQTEFITDAIWNKLNEEIEKQ